MSRIQLARAAVLTTARPLPRRSISCRPAICSASSPDAGLPRAVTHAVDEAQPPGPRGDEQARAAGDDHDARAERRDADDLRDQPGERGGPPADDQRGTEGDGGERQAGRDAAGDHRPRGGGRAGAPGAAALVGVGRGERGAARHGEVQGVRGEGGERDRAERDPHRGGHEQAVVEHGERDERAGLGDDREDDPPRVGADERGAGGLDRRHHDHDAGDDDGGHEDTRADAQGPAGGRGGACRARRPGGHDRAHPPSVLLPYRSLPGDRDDTAARRVRRGEHPVGHPASPSGPPGGAPVVRRDHAARRGRRTDAGPVPLVEDRGETRG